MEYLKLKGLDHHLHNLNKIVKNSKEPLEGNYFYHHLTFNTDSLMVNKQLNIIDIATKSDKILEIGFNAGHTALLMLAANENCHIYSFDTCSHIYTKPCLNYLNLNFNNRITMYEGNSHDTLKKCHEDNPNLKVDAIHIDGCHAYLHANIDFFLTKKFAKNGTYCIFDDTNNTALKSLWDGYVKDSHVIEIPHRDSTPHNHSIGVYNL